MARKSCMNDSPALSGANPAMAYLHPKPYVHFDPAYPSMGQFLAFLDGSARIDHEFGVLRTRRLQLINLYLLCIRHLLEHDAAWHVRQVKLADKISMAIKSECAYYFPRGFLVHIPQEPFPNQKPAPKAPGRFIRVPRLVNPPLWQRKLRLSILIGLHL